MRFVTDFFDQAVVLPLVLVFSAALAADGRGRAALVFLAGIGVTLGVVVAAKLALAACAPDGAWLHSPSGHTASAAALVGGVCVVLAVPRPLTAALIAAAIVGATRLALGEHTVVEVVAGAAIGFFGAALIVRGRPGGRSPRLRHPRATLAAMAAVVIATHGVHLPAEARIRDLAPVIWPLSACQSGRAPS